MTPDEIRSYKVLNNFTDVYNDTEIAKAIVLHGLAEMVQELSAQLAEIKELLRDRI